MSLSSDPEQRAKELEAFVHKLQRDLEKVSMLVRIDGHNYNHLQTQHDLEKVSMFVRIVGHDCNDL